MDKIKILIIGSNGQLGYELCQRVKKHDFTSFPFDLPEFDVTDKTSVQKTVTESNASLVINASAHTAVDRAESEPEIAFRVNHEGPLNLAESCAQAGIPLIHVSTDYVFDGCKKSPYLETDPVCPINVYGKSKVQGESAVRDRLNEHIILRTSWLYGVHGNNFVKTMLRLGKENETLRVVTDQYGCPTYAGDLAEAILTIANHYCENRNTAWGTYHFCGKGETSWHGFAEKIFELAKEHDCLKVKKVDPIIMEESPAPAQRPAITVLDCTKLSKAFNITPVPWEESLIKVISKLCKQIGSHTLTHNR